MSIRRVVCLTRQAAKTARAQAADILAHLDAIQRLSGGAELSSAYKNIKMEVLSIAVCLCGSSNDVVAMIGSLLPMYR